MPATCTKHHVLVLPSPRSTGRAPSPRLHIVPALAHLLPENGHTLYWRYCPTHNGHTVPALALLPSHIGLLTTGSSSE